MHHRVYILSKLYGEGSENSLEVKKEMINFLEFVETHFQEHPLMLYFDETGRAWIRRQDLVDVFGIKRAAVRELELPKAVIQSPAGAYVIEWGEAGEFAHGQGSCDETLAAIDEVTRQLSILPRQPHEKPEILHRSETDSSKTALVVRSDVPSMPASIKTEEDVSVYTENLRQVWIADQRQQTAEAEVKKFTGGALPELPEGVATLTEIKAYARSLFNMWVAHSAYTDIQTHFQTEPTVAWTPSTSLQPASNGETHEAEEPHAVQKDVVATVGLPLHPDIVDCYEGDPEALEREYDTLVNFIVKATTQPHGVVKKMGYTRLGEMLGVSFDAINGKPIDRIRENGWWKQGYRALWFAYKVSERTRELQTKWC